MKSDVFNNKIPKRVPIEVRLSMTVVADYAKIDRRAAYWNPSILKKAAEELCEMIPSDSCVYSPTIYSPVSSQPLDAINKVMSSTGFMQHPNTTCMSADEYDELIEDPYAFMLDKCIPRIYKALDPAINPGRHIFALTQEQQMRREVSMKDMPMIMELNKKYGYPSSPRPKPSRVPMDWIADQLRGFDGICLDVRRHRDKLIAALEACYPMIYKQGLQPNLENVSRDTLTSFQLHMASYLRVKDFEEVWFPTWKRQVTDYASFGIRSFAFLEDRWEEPLLEHMNQLPTGSYFTFEATDAKLMKEKLGKRHVLGGGFPIEYLLTCTKAEIIDRTKAWLDIMAPGGQYVFSFDKNALALTDINLENLVAVCETVRDYGVYDNPGQSTGEVFNKADYKHSEIVEFDSKYYMSWKKFVERYPDTPEDAKQIFQTAENNMLEMIFLMLC
jgi:hypothetical protein